jgi:hypothetical protein
MFHN